MVDELVHRCDVVVHLAAAVGREAHRRGAAALVHHQHPRLGDRDRRRPPLPPQDPRSPARRRSTARTAPSQLTRPPTGSSAPPRSSRWSYSTAKAVDEILAFAYHRERGLAVDRRAAVQHRRPPPEPGVRDGDPPARPPGARGEPLTVYGDGGQSRCFCHVHDVVDGAARGCSTHPGAIGEVFNVGVADEISILDLARPRRRAQPAARRRSSSSPTSEAYADGFEDMRRRVPDTTKIARAHRLGAHADARRHPRRRDRLQPA